jgi:hypothetical protein
MLLRIENFLGTPECCRLCQGFDAASRRARQRDYTGHPVLDWHIIRADPELASICKRVAERILIQIRANDETLDLETIILTAIGPGGHHPLHADNSKKDTAGNWVPNHTPDRAFSTIVYLNDNFEGGEIVFPLQNTRIKPLEGLLVGFPSGSEFVHEVLSVTRGRRYTLPMWFGRNSNSVTGSTPRKDLE